MVPHQHRVMGMLLCLALYTHPQWGSLLPLQTVHLFYMKICLFISKFLKEHSNLIATDTLEIHALRSPKLSERKHSTSSFYKLHCTQIGNIWKKVLTWEAVSCPLCISQWQTLIFASSWLLEHLFCISAEIQNTSY